MNWLAHSPRDGREDYLHDHLCKVGNRAAGYADAFGASDEAKLAGILHDLGKYGDLFQRRLQGKERHIDHWSAGVHAAITKGKALAAALAIQGHHVGLQQASKDVLNELLLWVGSSSREKRDNVSLSDANTTALFDRFKQDGLSVPHVAQGLYPRWDTTAAAMLDVRMLFSALVDADFVETEAHFEGRYREKGPTLNPAEALEILRAHIAEVAQKSDASDTIKRLRADLLGACLEKAKQPPGLFTLTAPTGSGKTLAMLAFALKHAAKHDLRRVVTVIPYLSIIEQTAAVYRDAFRDRFDSDRYVIEHHSMANARSDERKTKDDDQGSAKEPPPIARLLAENWDAPIIVTTSVQFLESLFANRPGPCRKLHRLAKSVILFDEVQTLPVSLAIPTLATLSHLSARYGATVVFSTATQPAFRELDEKVRAFAPSGWSPREIVPPETDLFGCVRRTRAEWPKRGEKMTWDQLTDGLLDVPDRRALCIVNLRPHARTVYSALKERGVEGLFHLSTYMCPAHRQNVLETVKARLDAKEPCLLISTQCVEAGVDLDFPAVFRAFGPLDAIAQAAGRCNRNGKGPEGIMTVFTPDVGGNLYPDGAYKQGASVAEALVSESYGKLDINDPSVYERYYRSVYALRKLEEEGKDLMNAIRAQNFAEVAEKYHLIPNDSVNVVVPYDLKEYNALKQEAEEKGLTACWIRKARPHTVGVFRSKRDTIPYLCPVPVRPGSHEKSEEWFIYLKEEYDPQSKEGYDREALGLVQPENPVYII